MPICWHRLAINKKPKLNWIDEIRKMSRKKRSISNYRRSKSCFFFFFFYYFYVWFLRITKMKSIYFPFSFANHPINFISKMEREKYRKTVSWFVAMRTIRLNLQFTVESQKNLKFFFWQKTPICFFAATHLSFPRMLNFAILMTGLL